MGAPFGPLPPYLSVLNGRGWRSAMEHITHEPYGNWQVFLWTLVAVVILGLFICLFNSENAATKFFLARISKQKACRNTGHIYCTLAVFPSRIQVNALKRKKAAAQSEKLLCAAVVL